MILHVLDQGIVIVDVLSGTGHHRLEWMIHWSPLWEITRNEGASGSLGSFRQWFGPDGVRPQVSAENFTASAAVGDLDVTFLGPEGTETFILRGSVNPTGGWYSRSYGLKEPISTLRATVQTELPTRFVTLVKPRGRDLTIPPETLTSVIPGAGRPTCP
jgi:hypothetical protein